MIRATARLQFHEGFTLDQATALVPYLDQLGVSHIYASPLLRARPGSTHGYDIVDHHVINPELGGEDALRRLVAALRARDMGLVLDIVPNHMGVGGSDNAWWLDVLEWGRASPYADYFDIDWDPPDSSLRGKLLAPFLGESYGATLDAGDLVMRFDDAEGRLFVAYHDHRFPVAIRDYPDILRTHFDALAERFAEVAGDGGRDATRRRAEQARMALRSEAAERPEAMTAALAAYAPDTQPRRDRLHALLERQSYRLAWWRVATDEINWRRFFDVNGLAGVRVEEPRVFDDTHSYIFQLYAEGLIDGVRIDHVDGLADPRGYCRKLRRRLAAEAAKRPPGLPAEPAVVWIEKILAPHEHLATDWLTDGTTGYDFMAQVSALLHDPRGEAPLTALWTRLTGRPGDFLDEAKPARRQILREALSSELFATAAAIHRIARRDLATRDYTLTSIRRALEEVLVQFPVYRIYAGVAGIDATDEKVLAQALAQARATVRDADQHLLTLIGGWLRGEGLRAVPAGTRRHEWLRAMVKFEQLSSPTAAKSVEDTSFYRFGRLLSRNEVGSEPSQFALSPDAAHEANAERRRRFPRALLATATHDHKRGEDARARLGVLSEIPDEWAAALERWMGAADGLRRDGAPDAADEIMLYQTLVGAWPLDLAPDDADGLRAFGERVAAWQEKALREAKRHSGWAAPDAEYEGACRAFLDGLLEPGGERARDLAAFVERVAPAGAAAGLAQTMLRLTSPGVPDLYQGAEFWDFSLVDPDNRRPVGFDARTDSLARGGSPAELVAHWRDGRVKQAMIHRALEYRRRAPGLFAHGAYVPIKAEGELARHVFAFARVHEGRAAITIVARLAAALVNASPELQNDALARTYITLPRRLVGRRITDVVSGAEHEGRSGRLSAADALRLPACLLELT